MKRTLILFAKAPVPGKVKTRLSPVLTPEQCAELAEALIKDSAALLQRAEAEERRIAYAPVDGEPLLRQQAGPEFDYRPQSEGDLGDRMRHAFEEAFAEGSTAAVIIGSDSPAIPAEWINEALASLADHDIVLGPTADCGYYLIGLSSSSWRQAGSLSALSENFFNSIEWSTDKVLPVTLGRISEMHLKLHLLPPWIDLDTPDSLKFFRAHLKALELVDDSSLPKDALRVLSDLSA